MEYPLVMGRTVEETTCFKLLDSYARSNHQCFLAEMDLNAARARYTLCFRPEGVEENSPNRYTSRYLHIGRDEVGTAGRTNELPAAISEMLDRQLHTLHQ